MVLEFPECFICVSATGSALRGVPDVAVGAVTHDGWADGVENWRNLYVRRRCCHCFSVDRASKLTGMAILILIFAFLAILAVAAGLGLTPDTHREEIQHGDFKF